MKEALDFRVNRPASLELRLTVHDPEVAAELTERPEGDERERYALTALKIGVLALRQARGRVDADAVRREGERVMAGLETRLTAHRESLTRQLSGSLSEYFDPESGRFHERVERLVRRDGELEQVMRRLVGADESELSRTLASHVGENSRLMKLLGPDEANGVVAAMSTTVDESLRVQRERILSEFSLDNREGALARLVDELTQRHGKLGEEMRGNLQDVVREFSLDDENSALSRLVRRVERTQQQISSEFSLDEEQSALARMRRDLLEVLGTHDAANRAFQDEVKSALAAMQARRAESRRSTRHGGDYEAAVVDMLRRETQVAGDILSETGTTPGLIKNCKVGDAVVELGPDRAAAGTRIVVEAKAAAGYSLDDARRELEIARKNRDAAVGVLVIDRRNAPDGLEPLVRYGDDLVVAWDADDPTTDVYLHAGLSVARALCTRAVADHDDATTRDLDAIVVAVRDIEKQTAGLDEITRSTETIRSSSEKILRRAGLIRERLVRHVAVLDARMDALKR